jgi:hypothetical protein
MMLEPRTEAGSPQPCLKNRLSLQQLKLGLGGSAFDGRKHYAQNGLYLKLTAFLLVPFMRVRAGGPFRPSFCLVPTHPLQPRGLAHLYVVEAVTKLDVFVIGCGRA